jgi:hypothetical protein
MVSCVCAAEVYRRMFAVIPKHQCQVIMRVVQEDTDANKRSQARLVIGTIYRHLWEAQEDIRVRIIMDQALIRHRDSDHGYQEAVYLRLLLNAQEEDRQRLLVDQALNRRRASKKG